MPADRSTPRGRTRGTSAPQSLWLSAMWSGLGTAIVASIVSVVAVAIVWLPASDGSGSAGSALRAGALTFLAALHAGITLDGIDAAFVPLGMTILVGLLAWRAGAALAAAADESAQRRTDRLLALAAVQAGTFAIACGVLAGVSRLGTSSVSVVGATIAGFVLFTVAAGSAFVRGTSLAQDVATRGPDWMAPAARAAAAALGVYLAVGAALVAGSLVVHHDRVAALSREVGGGWSGVPILLLGVLAAPNAAIAGAGYLSGAGFAVGTGTTVGLGSTTHGVVPAFPLLGALPDGTGSTTPAWLLAVVAPILAGTCVALVARRAESPPLRWRDAGIGVLGTALGGAVLAWQGGGAIGSGRLHTVGASPWEFGVALVVGVGGATVVVLGALTATDALRAKDVSGPGTLRATLSAVKDAIGTEDDFADPDDTDADAVTVQLTERDGRKRKKLAG